MTALKQIAIPCACVLALSLSLPARSNDLDALDLEGKAPAEIPAKNSPTRIFVEGAAGRISQRYGLSDLDSNRLSLDIKHQSKLGENWRVAFSNRLDHLRPAGSGYPSTLNSVREAYVGWQNEEATTLFELGRVNWRYGTGYGYRPTDIFRDGSLRAVTTADPLAQRENRLGTVMLRGQYIGSAGTVSLAYAPKVATQPSRERFSFDAGSTNNRDRAVLSYSFKSSDRLNGQVLVAYDEIRGTQFGINGTALVSDALVAHGEWLRGKDQLLVGSAPGSALQRDTRDRAVLGLTYAGPHKISLTAEYQYNGFAPTQAQWSQLTALGPVGTANFLLETQRRQEIASRGAYLFYLTQRSFIQQNLDLTALLRVNAQDHSRLAWVELRYRASQFDIAVQYQVTGGGLKTEYGILPYRQAVQLLGAYYF
ncbi:MAG: hypothetical protein RIS44_2332 [Pseudomonadota bacterium]